MEWQPIETAPKDGAWILVMGGKTDEDFYCATKENRRPAVVKFCNEDKDWVMCFWDGNWRTGYQSPTHWMPLPPPPIEWN